jgi:transposase
VTIEKNITITESEYTELLQFKKEFVLQKSEIELLKFQLAELKRLIFGAKSERYISPDPNQLNLFDIPEEKAAEKPQEEITYTRNKPEEKKHPLRLELPSHLPRRPEIIEPENLPENAKKIGESITEILEYEPANIYVRQLIRPKYIIEQNDEKTSIITAELPTLPIPKGNAGASMLAYIFVSKFVDHLPFYRQIQIIKRQNNIIIPESTMGGWFNAGCRLLESLYEPLKKIIFSSDYLMADETPIPVLTRDKPGATHKGYYWVYYDPVNKLVLFDYQKTRSREGPDELLKNFSGYLQTDGYTAYNNLNNEANIIHLACMAHARRKFEHALENHHDLATEAMNMFGTLYDIERYARDEKLSYDEIKELRQKESVPILKKMELWLKEKINQTLPKSAIGMAMSYTLSLWSRLIKYCDDGRFYIDNNLIENSIRPVALGRKNYLFAGSHEAAQRAAMVYSFLATCKINNVEPYAWFKNTLSVLPDTKVSQLHTLLPRQK